jgi:Ni,Fe-hydrogenase I cytochrome b subunit
VTALAVVLATVLSYAVGWVIGAPFLVPILNTAASFPFMVAALRRGQVGLAVARMLVWALAMGVAATLLSYARPAQTDALFLRGASYRAEMFRWVSTGRGAESSPSQFLPQHARDLALFSTAAVLTGGMLAMAMGAALMNYMGHYVGSLAAASRSPVVTMALGWHPWAIIRVISFVILGVLLSMPILSRLYRFRVDWRAARPLFATALAGLILDVTLKSLLAPAWQRLLLRVVGW